MACRKAWQPRREQTHDGEEPERKDRIHVAYIRERLTEAQAAP